MSLPSPPKQDPLAAARLRHQRGKECLRDVETAVTALGVVHERGDPTVGLALAYEDPDSGTWIPLPYFRTVPLEVVFGVSEMVYNLKVSLDYVTYALFEQALAQARISSREFDRLEKDVQFPVKDTPQKLRKWCFTHRQWLRSEERAIFNRAQPYCRSFMRLVGDDYLDKHRTIQKLIVSVDLSSARFKETGAVIDPPYLEWDGIKVYGFDATGLPPSRKVAMYANGSVEITLQGGAPVVETLQYLSLRSPR